MLKLWRRPDAVKGTWRIRGSVGGKRYDESTGTDSRAHAEAILAKRQKEILDALTWGPERTTTFADAVTLYLTNGGEARFLEPLVLAFGPRRLADITQADVMAYIRAKHPNTGPQGINRQVYTPLIAVCRMAHKAGMGAAPAFVRPKMPRKKLMRYATDDQLVKLLPHCSERLAAAVLLMSLGGVRVSEACRLVEADVDFATARIKINTTKNGDSRVISAGPLLMQRLEALRGADGPLFGFASRFSLNQALARACKRAGIETFTSHKVGRHAFAARHLAQGRTISELQHLGGWKSPSIVAEAYGHLEQSRLDQIMRETGANLAQHLTGSHNVIPLKRLK